MRPYCNLCEINNKLIEAYEDKIRIFETYIAEIEEINKKPIECNSVMKGKEVAV